MITDPSFYAVALPAVALYGLSKGGFAGISLLATPLMALVMSPVQAAAILLPVLIVQDTVTIYAYRRDWDAETLKRMLPGALVGIIFGTLTAAILSTAHIRFAVGLLAVAFCLNAWFGPDLRQIQPRPHAMGQAFGLSALSGYTSFVIHAGGPPFNIYALPRLTEPRLFIGTSAIFFGVMNVLKVPPYLALGQFTVSNLSLSVVLIPVAVATNLAGIWLVRRLSKSLIYKIMYGLTFLIGMKLIVDGVTQLRS